MAAQSESANDGVAIYRRLLSFAVPYWKIFLVALLGMVVFSITEMAFAKLIEPLLDGSFVDKDPELIFWIPILLISVFIVRGLGYFLSNYGMAWISRSVVRDLRELLFSRMLKLPTSYFDITSPGTLVSRMVFNMEQLSEASANVVIVLLRDSLSILGLLILMFTHSVPLTLMLLVVTPFLAVIVNYVTKRFRKLSHRIQGTMGDVSTVTEESIDAHREIKIFGGQEYEHRRFAEANNKNRRQFLKMAATNSTSTPIIELIVAVAFAGIIYVAVQEDVSVGKFTSFMTAMILLMQHARRLVTVNATLQRGIAAAQNIFAFIDAPSEVDSGREVLERVQGRVQFKDITFSYIKEETPVLRGINLEIDAGQSVAFVGRSGAGKTTLVSLLPRFYELTEGSITLDGHDIRDIRLSSLRSQIALVSQHVTLFNDTIAHNIAYGALERTEEEDILRAAKAAHALEFIERLPQGFNTLVGENGVLLSGGQRQRIAIARAILKDAPILILDEATSALDTESERHIQAALNELMRDRTTLVIAHRLSTIERVDKIVVLENGQIVEAGRHQELLDKQGAYARLYQLQFQDVR